MTESMNKTSENVVWKWEGAWDNTDISLVDRQTVISSHNDTCTTEFLPQIHSLNEPTRYFDAIPERYRKAATKVAGPVPD